MRWPWQWLADRADARDRERSEAIMEAQSIVLKLKTVYGVPKHMLDRLGELEHIFHFGKGKR